MGEYTISILVILGTGVLIGLIFYLVNRKNKQKEALIIQLAQKQGWKYQKVSAAHEKGFVLQGDGWKFESLAISSSSSSDSGSSSVFYSNLWFSDRCTSTGGLVMIGPKMPPMLMGGMADLFLQQAMRLMLGAEADDANGLHEVDPDRLAFQERYSIFAVDEGEVDSVLTFEAENALLNWKLKEKPIVKVFSRGIEIRMKDGRVEKPEDILAVIELGKAFIL